jgi:hypothetical protein
MPYRRKSSDDDVSLFPFLSIIACLIGVLTMMIATLALAQTDTQDVALVEIYERTNRQLDLLDQEILTLRRQLEATNSSALTATEQQQQLDITLRELEQLLAAIEEIDQQLAEQQRAPVVIPEIDPELRETLAQMQSQQQSLEQQIAALQASLAERQVAGEAQVTVLPQGSGLNFVPAFVECADGAVVMHHLPTPKTIRAGEIVSDPDFLALLESVANGVSESIVFLVRSDGLNVYQACKQICDQRQIRHGKLPVVGKGRIDLSAFARQAERADRNQTRPASQP